jgi:hypothetical protein
MNRLKILTLFFGFFPLPGHPHCDDDVLSVKPESSFFNTVTPREKNWQKKGNYFRNMISGDQTDGSLCHSKKFLGEPCLFAGIHCPLVLHLPSHGVIAFGGSPSGGGETPRSFQIF